MWPISRSPPSDSTYTLAREIEKVSCVEHTATSYDIFISHPSGNNVMLPGDPKQLFNFACLYWAESSILETMGLTLVEGEQPTRLDRPG